MAQYISETTILHNGKYIPDDAGNRDYRELIASGVTIAPLPAPAIPIPDLSFAQLLIGLVTEEWITEAEGGGWLVGTLPAPVLAVIATLPSNQQFAAKARAIRPSAVVRADPLVGALAAAEGKSSADIDAFFTTYSGV